ncbi:hypothetical protein [Janibacter cremeus]|uniref:Uncharacterized protein n=1 Tax=Janibacter cremeus TaxID=1285192 RepID=A0A852VYC2_9MICO|nr:hypothetical protein [Janibacter cremeus]NYF99214.1 hypothetical protein [Janibacter cremeus]
MHSTTMSTAAHTAVLDPMTGETLLIRPNRDEDVRDPFTPLSSAHVADWSAMVQRLDGMGWEPSEDDNGGTLDAGETADGRAILGLYCPEPIHEQCDLDRLAAASADLMREVDRLTAMP